MCGWERSGCSDVRCGSVFHSDQFPSIALNTLTQADDSTLHWRQPEAMKWRFDQVGVWKPQMRAFVGEELVATLEVANVWLGNRASLVAPSGQVIARWVMTSFLAGTVEWQDADGALLITFRCGTDKGGVGSWLRTQCRVDFTPAGFAHPDRDLLLTIGWYFTVLASNPATRPAGGDTIPRPHFRSGRGCMRRTGLTYALTRISWPSAFTAATPNTWSSMDTLGKVKRVTLPTYCDFSQSLLHAARQYTR